MKITLFTSNQSRHNYFINLLSSVCEDLFVIQECNTIFPGVVPGYYKASLTLKNYFEFVNKSQNKYFGNSYIINKKKNIRLLTILAGDLNKCSLNYLSDFLDSDIYIVFGSSYIKGELIEYLVDKKTINIHAGLSPYYRGTDCNFWALYDDNSHLVGCTIHLLSKGLDSGPILYHAMSTITPNPFDYTMSTIKSAFHSIAERIKNRLIFEITPIPQDKNKEIRYSKKIDFNDDVAKEFLNKKIIKLKDSRDSIPYLKEPFFFEN